MRSWKVIRMALPLVLAAACLLPFAIGCSGSSSSSNDTPTDPAEPAFSASRFSAQSTTIDNPFFPLVPGTTWEYEAVTADGLEHTTTTVSHETREVAGVACAIVVDRVYLDGELIEETFDWYAQDVDGNVWYLGEDSAEYDAGVAVSTAGSWETDLDVAGVGANAEPGIIMKAVLQAGDSYRQEYYPGEAEDMGTVEATGVTVTLGSGQTYTRCLQTKDWSVLNSVVEFKYYAPGVGLVQETQEDGSEPVVLTRVAVDTAPAIDPANFLAAIDNPYLPLTPGATLTYEGQTADGLETNEVVVSSATKVILGVTCTVVEDRVYVDGELAEETYDWFAQDADGNVWYFGEDVSNYEYDDQGNLIATTHDGAWEAGVDGAQPGIVMKADPRVGDSYRQEYYAGVAEDLGTVVSVDETVTVPYGTFDHVVKTKDRSPLEPGVIEYKYYAPLLGLILETQQDGSEPIALQTVTGM